MSTNAIGSGGITAHRLAFTLLEPIPGKGQVCSRRPGRGLNRRPDPR